MKTYGKNRTQYAQLINGKFCFLIGAWDNIIICECVKTGKTWKAERRTS